MVGGGDGIENYCWFVFLNRLKIGFINMWLKDRCNSLNVTKTIPLGILTFAFLLFL